MGLLDRALEELKIDEGYRQFVYKDTRGILTVGFGRNLESRGIDPEESHYLLRNDILHVLKTLTELDCWDSLSEARQAVLVNMAVNLGVKGLLGFQKMLKALREGDYDEAAREMLDSRWTQQVGKRALRLSETMRTGV